MIILVVGDVVGKPGRKAINELLPDLRQQYGLDMVIVNAENAAGGQYFTLPGNHFSTWTDNDIHTLLGIRVARLSNLRNTTRLNADIRLHDAPVVHN